MATVSTKWSSATFPSGLGGLNLSTVLVVDDETSILQLVAYNFTRAGFNVDTETNGQAALVKIQQNPSAYDLVVLDLMLPGLDGMELCKQIRQLKIVVPVILLTARDEEVDLVLGLELGADDYVTKPFSPRELVARAKAVMRRFEQAGQQVPSAHAATAGKVLTAGGIRIDLARHEVVAREKAIELTPKEYDLLRYLMEHREMVLSRDQLLDHVWGYTVAMDTRIVDVHISHLRDKVEADPKQPVLIRTVRGVGYRFTEQGRTS